LAKTIYGHPTITDAPGKNPVIYEKLKIHVKINVENLCRYEFSLYNLKEKVKNNF